MTLTVAIVTAAKFIGAALSVGIASCGAGIGIGLVAARGVEGIARQPEASGKIQGVMFLGIALAETAAIYGLIIAILLLFVF